MIKFAGLLLGAVVLGCVLTGCGRQQAAAAAATTTVYGQIANIEGRKITIKVAELPDKNALQNKSQIEGQLVLTGKEQTVTVSDKTDIKKRDMQGGRGSLSDIYVGSMVDLNMQGDVSKKLTIISSNEEDEKAYGPSKGNIELTGSLQVDGKSENSEKESIGTSKENQNAVLVKNKGTLSMTGAKLTKAGNTTSADESSFYGVNAVFATTAGSETSLSKSELTSGSEGANGIFATGKNALIHVDNVKIDTSGDNSQGLETTYGGRIIAQNPQITTSGMRCAPVAAGRGGGSVTVKGGTVSSSGEGSPCIYSAGAVIAENVKGGAEESPAVIVDGNSSLSLIKCKLTSGYGEGVMLYRGITSGAAEGTSSLKAADASLNMTADGPMFYITNTNSEISLKNTDLKFPGKTLVMVTKNSAGKHGTANNKGGSLTLTAKDQNLYGDIVCDEDSTAVVNLTKNAKLKGAVNNDKKGRSIELYLSKAAHWELTGDSNVTVLKNEDDTLSNIKSNGYNIYYDSNNQANQWLGGKTLMLDGGGKIAPQ